MPDSTEGRHGSKGLSTDKGNLEGWSIPQPEAIPAPTYWPFILSLGAALMGLGLLTSDIIGITGLVLFIVSIIKWTGELYHEERQ